MLRIIANASPAGAKSYYTTADYYSEGQELEGVWRGKGAERLGLAGTIEKADWDALCDNLRPGTAEPLTLRTKSNRRVGYDFNFHVPKSFSLLYSQTQDERLLDAFRLSMQQTMTDLEAEVQARVRKEGRNEDRTTGNMVWGEYIHFTSRPVEGVPDPQLHGHCFVMNATFDDVEHVWKAGEFGGLKRDASYFEAKFHSRLASRVRELGLDVERTKTGWEIAGLTKPTLDKFSRRTAQIEAAARRQGITDPEAKAELGAKTRSRKQQELPLDELRRLWDARLTTEERSVLERLAQRIGEEPLPNDAEAARRSVEIALSDVFERQSVVPERKLLAAAIKQSLGKTTDQAVEHAVREVPLIVRDRQGRRMVTTPTVLTEERQLLAFARQGRGTKRPFLIGSHTFRRTWLNADQRRAVEHVLRSTDRVTLIRGAAGVGKTSMMKEAVEAIEATGTQVFTFAPSARASRGVLREKEGFATADTVSRLLVDEQLQRQLQGQTIWIDEAGMVGSRTMARVFEIAEANQARVILSGDRYQHGSVERGAALRLLEEEAGLVPAEIKEIQRQTGAYKQAVRALSEGRIADAFTQLDQLQWIREVDDVQRYRVLANDYVETVLSGETALVVSPTHLEAERCTNAIRDQLKTQGVLAADEQTISILKNAQLTVGELADPVNYSPADVLVFHQNAKGYRKGQRVTLNQEPPPVDQAARYQLYHPDTLAVAVGDVLQVTRNGKSLDGQPLHNGDLVHVTGFDGAGHLETRERKTIPREYGHLAYGYVITSYGSQGTDVDRVFLGQSAESVPASSQEQFYVSVSRGKKQATIYTDSKPELLAAVQQTDARLSATELVNGAIETFPLPPLVERPADAERPRRVPKELIHER